jgi:hypothetical protein
MTQFNVHYTLYASNGSTLVYTFPLVQSDNSPQDPKDFVEIAGLRGVGSIIIAGSTQPWDLVLRFILMADDYEALITKMDALETTIAPLTNYVLKIDRNVGGSVKSYNVKRLTPFQFAEGFRTDYQEVTVTFRVNSWA